MENAEFTDIFGAGGAVSRAIKGFEPRGQQARMAAAVAQAVGEGEHLVVEAGTGVGKSLGYLIPAALWAARNQKKVVVATHTKALQAQLVKKDLPVVKAVLQELGLPLSYFLLMGSSNYLCLSRLARAGKQAPELFDEEGLRAALEQLQAWIHGAESGSRAELPFAVPHHLWAEVCRDSDLCLGKKCPHKAACFHRKDVARAAKADIVVVNQHLFFAGMPLPAFNAVIFDEAHNLEEVAADFMGFSLTDRRVKRFLDDIFAPKSNKGLSHRLSRPPTGWVEDVKGAVSETRHASKDFFREITEKLALNAQPAGRARTCRVREPGIVANLLQAPLLELSVLLSQAIPHSQSDMEEAEVKACLKRCLELAAQVNTFLECKEAACAYWVEVKSARKKEEISLNMSPVDVSEDLRKNLFGRNYPVLLTSATLAVDGSFSMLKARIGLDQCNELLLDSPFDYTKQAGILVPQDMPDPAAEAAAYEAAVLDACVKVCGAVEGGIFLLFTSWQSLERAARVLAGRLSGRLIFKQGEELPAKLIADFKHAGNGVLLATDTFWQGVDVPGQALACVVIARLPFTSPDTPLEETRQEWMTAKGQNFFVDYTLPKAVVKFRQGVGRLIRTKKDFGAIVILDPRVQTKRYGGKFVRSIPRCARLGDFKDLKAFFAARRRQTI
ncbi:MAG: hypothetical protein A2X31_02480 [Elusimicrobia bacterium GWB2_63_22]|nr:MAG: hypothetical protein A2X31_02480 [Elusimicrobia bacterium GWB2_63_22]